MYTPFRYLYTPLISVCYLRADWAGRSLEVLHSPCSVSRYLQMRSIVAESSFPSIDLFDTHSLLLSFDTQKLTQTSPPRFEDKVM